jgi:hypothetical protein
MFNWGKTQKNVSEPVAEIIRLLEEEISTLHDVGPSILRRWNVSYVDERKREFSVADITKGLYYTNHTSWLTSQEVEQLFCVCHKYHVLEQLQQDIIKRHDELVVQETLEIPEIEAVLIRDMEQAVESQKESDLYDYREYHIYLPYIMKKGFAFKLHPDITTHSRHGIPLTPYTIVHLSLEASGRLLELTKRMSQKEERAYVVRRQKRAQDERQCIMERYFEEIEND